MKKKRIHTHTVTKCHKHIFYYILPQDQVRGATQVAATATANYTNTKHIQTILWYISVRRTSEFELANPNNVDAVAANLVFQFSTTHRLTTSLPRPKRDFPSFHTNRLPPLGCEGVGVRRVRERITSSDVLGALGRHRIRSDELMSRHREGRRGGGVVQDVRWL